jgi:hypothetical protein
MTELLEITNNCDDWEWEDNKEYLGEILSKTRIKNGFLHGVNLGWQRLTGYTEPFEINVDNFIDKIGLNGAEWILRISKKGHKLYINRYSHDEPTGASMMLSSSKHYKEYCNKGEIK